MDEDASSLTIALIINIIIVIVIPFKFMPYNHDGYWVRITLNSGKTMDYILGDKKNYRVDDELDKDKVLLRSWHKTGSQPYNDIVPIA